MDNVPLCVGILLFEEVELLDFAGPYEVLTMANAVAGGRDPRCAPFLVRTVSEMRHPIGVRGGLRVLPDCGVQECPDLSALVVPGGPGVRRAVDNQALVEWVAARAREGRLVASVCTGAFLLARAGLLAGRRVTTHWAAADELARACPEATVVRGKRVVDGGGVITAAGVSAGIDLALYLVSRYLGEELARQTARRLEYPFPGGC